MKPAKEEGLVILVQNFEQLVKSICFTFDTLSSTKAKKEEKTRSVV